MKNVTKKVVPANEYTVEYYPLSWGGKKSPYAKWDVSEGEDMVTKRIYAALAKIDMPATVRDCINFEVKLVEGGHDKNYSRRKFTRVYIGRRSYGWNKRDRQMLVSKANQSIDLGIVTAAIVERAKNDRQAEVHTEAERVRENESEEVAKAINKEFHLGYSSRVRVSGDSDKNSVSVELSGSFSPSDARKIVAFIKNL